VLLWIYFLKILCFRGLKADSHIPYRTHAVLKADSHVEAISCGQQIATPREQNLTPTGNADKLEWLINKEIITPCRWHLEAETCRGTNKHDNKLLMSICWICHMVLTVSEMSRLDGHGWDTTGMPKSPPTNTTRTPKMKSKSFPPSS
jgi:hypothetical protein